MDCQEVILSGKATSLKAYNILMALKDDEMKNYSQHTGEENSSDQEIMVKKFEKEFFSLNDFIK